MHSFVISELIMPATFFFRFANVAKQAWPQGEMSMMILTIPVSSRQRSKHVDILSRRIRLPISGYCVWQISGASFLLFFYYSIWWPQLTWVNDV